MVASIIETKIAYPVDDETLCLVYSKDIAKLQGMAETVFAAMLTLRCAEAGVRRIEVAGYVGMGVEEEDVFMQERDQEVGNGDGPGEGQVQACEREQGGVDEVEYAMDASHV